MVKLTKILVKGNYDAREVTYVASSIGKILSGTMDDRSFAIQAKIPKARRHELEGRTRVPKNDVVLYDDGIDTADSSDSDGEKDDCYTRPSEEVE